MVLSKNIYWKAIFASLALLFLLGGFSASANAQEGTRSTIEICPIVGVPYASLTTPSKEVTVEDTLTATLELTHPSLYTLPGVRVGVALYSEGVNTPSYWMILGDTKTLPSGETTKESLRLDLSNILPGTYDVKVYAAQGATEAFAHAVRNGAADAAITITKTTDAVTTPEMSVTFTVAGEAADEVVSRNDSLSVAVVTEVPSQTIVSRDGVPLGSAVVLNNETAVGEHTYDLGQIIFGAYSAHVINTTPDQFAPVVQADVIVETAEQNFSSIYPYLSVIGTTAYPLNNGAEITACTAFYSPDGVYTKITPEPIAVDLAITNQAGEVLAESEQQTPRLENFATFALALVPADATIVTSLATKARDGSGFNPVQQIAIEHECSDCTPPVIETVNDFVQDETVQYSFWFYAGIILAAALLMVLMLRRLDPQPEEPTYQSPEEIQ